MKKLILAVVGVAVFAAALFAGYRIADEMFLPGKIYLNQGEEFSYAGGLLTIKADESDVAEAAVTKNGSYSAELCLFGTIPIKTVRVTSVNSLTLVPGGMPFGVKMFTSGVIVVGMGDVESRNGRSCPAKDAGLELGDVVITVNGRYISGNDALLGEVNDSEGNVIEIIYMRNGERKTARIQPALSADGIGWRIGMWVRDSSAGIGTATYYNPKTGLMGGLGHGITDVDTGIVLPVESGEIARVAITGISKGQAGSPGELKGVFLPGAPVANLLYNCECGVFAEVISDSFFTAKALPVTFKQDVEAGPALILCTVEGESPRYYEIEIETVRLSDTQPTKNLIIRVTDFELIAKAGGIVQGMSGSPIVQNGCIIGAVTHVFVNEPTKGYGIFIENMIFSESYATAEQKVG